MAPQADITRLLIGEELMLYAILDRYSQPPLPQNVIRYVQF